MALSSILSTADSLLSGNHKKATITIEKAAASGSGAAGRLTSLASQALTSGVSSLTGGTAGLGTAQTLSVCYNPSSISFQANAEPTDVSYLLQNVDNGVPRQQTRPPSLTMSVDLVFDDTNVKDAFMSEKFKLLTLNESVSGLANSGAALARTVTGNHYSVQDQTNGLVATLLDDSTRTVTFQWAKLSFRGEVSQVQARYTMFSTSGRPIRSIVTLVISQKIDASSQMEKWNSAFDSQFKASLSEAGSRSVGQKVGNLLNITGF